MPKALIEAKNVNLASMAFARLKLFINDCDPVTPEIAASTARYIENALFTKEINETEYLANIEMLRDETNRFRNSCSCIEK